ncbi:endolytic transglycosylase MltG [Arcobacter sp. FWKO B]|uniref:endolytic transglycosylase MltG n=1 Tax=Arcobacter sp. FWKO B TaxID=2593672 RepID=UPI001D188DB4|nr:endolytic transglycosylase MltG [Arcobacter sp. FWKO B]
MFYLSMQVYSSRVIFIPQGSTNSIISYLSKSGYELNVVDNISLRFFLGYPQSGWIDLEKTKMTKGDFLYKLTTSKAAMRTVTLIPGDTYYEFFQNIANELGLSFDILLEAYNELKYQDDGNIIADSYNIPIGMDEQFLMYYLISHTQKRYSEMSHKIFGEYNKLNWYRYLTVASIVQKEAANDQEMPIVASVVYNRLSRGMPLQMDGTLKYGQHSKRTITPAIIREEDTPYNTYKYKGVPPSPICNVSVGAIIAAIKPKNTDFLYFVRDKTTRTHIFSKTYNEHLANINYTRVKESSTPIRSVATPTKPIPKIHEKNQIEPSVLSEPTKPIDIKSLFENIR